MRKNDEASAVRLKDITKRFGDVVANDSVDLTLEKGTIHALLGENGSGKTTLMSVLYGLYDQDGGSIHVNGERQAFDSPRDAMDAGIGMIHQHFQLVETMTVLQNIVLGHEPTEHGLVNMPAAEADVAEICSRYGFDVDQYLHTPVRELDLGAQQRIEIVKSLYRGADILILDEPTAVLTPQEVESLINVMNDLVEAGHSLIFITHKLEEALETADDITVLRDGKAISTVDADETSEQELAQMMVGRDVEFDRLSRVETAGEPVLEIEGLSMKGDRDLKQVDDMHLTVREGEIFGIAGVQGNGQSELIEGITGLRTPESGSIRLHDEEITEMNHRQCIESGIAYIPEDRQAEGLVQTNTLIRNALLGNQTIEPYVDGQFVDWNAVRDHSEEIIEEFDVRPPNPDAVASSLSGGNQQKFIVGREIKHDPDILIAAHPTRGVDIGSIEFIHNRLVELRDGGLAIIIVSSKLEEVQKLSDRIGVMYEGDFIDTVDPEHVSEDELGLLMAGHHLDAEKESTKVDTDEGTKR